MWACCWMVLYWHRNTDKTQVLIAFFAYLHWRGSSGVCADRYSSGRKQTVSSGWGLSLVLLLRTWPTSLHGSGWPTSDGVKGAGRCHSLTWTVAFPCHPGVPFQKSLHLSVAAAQSCELPTMFLWSCWDCIPVTLHRPLITPISFSWGMC